MTELLQEDMRLLRQPPDLRLDGKAVWLTGASRGLGRALALALAGAGAEVLLMARDGAALAQTSAAIAQAGGVAHVVEGSVTEARDVGRAVATIEREWGRLDVLVNNAGVGSSFRRAEQVDAQEWDDVLAVNLDAPFACCKAALPLLDAAGGGSVVNVSSVHGLVAGARLAAYAASKGGLELLTRTLAVEWAPRGIRVNSVAPGYLITDMTAGLRENARLSADLLSHVPLGRFAGPHEVVPAVLFLAGEVSSYVTGATFCVDGGWTAQ